MPTTVTKSIGTSSRDYSTLQSWEDACPANLVTDDKIWRGEAYNDSEFSGTGNRLTISGTTVDSTHYVELTAATGQSFCDNAGVQTNALKYNASNGVGIRTTDDGVSVCVTISQAYTRISRVQIQHDGATYGVGLIISGSTCLGRNLIVQGHSNILQASSVTTQIINSLLIHPRTGVPFVAGILADFGLTLINCTIVRPSDHAGTGVAISGEYTDWVVKNCAFFGWATIKSGSSSPGCVTSMCDVASGLSGMTDSKTYANQFQGTTSSAPDFRAKTGADLLDAGTTDSTASPDIADTTRPSGGAYDIGCWEFVAAASGNPKLIAGRLTRPNLVRGRLVA